MGGNLSVATAAVADSTTREKRSSGLAIVGIAFGLGFIVGPAIGGLFAMVDLTTIAPSLEAFGVNPFSVPALISLILSLINLAWISHYFEETLPESKRVMPSTKRRTLDVFRIFQSTDTNTRRTNFICM